MKKYSKQKSIRILLLLFLMLVLIATFTLTKWDRGLTLVQLSARGPRQMMGYVIQTYADTCIVIDGGTGTESEQLLNQIKGAGGTVEAWYLTHPHIDHMGAFLSIMKEHAEEITVNHIYTTLNTLEWYETYSSPDRIEEIREFFKIIETVPQVEEVQLGQMKQYDNVNIEVLGVKNPEITVNNINNSSMILRLTIADKSVLFLADTGEQSGEKFLKNTSKEKIESDYVQMAHHGQAGVKKEVYQKVKPKYCLWPCPDWLYENKDKVFQTDETKQWVQELQVKENYIADKGNITLRIW